jgi:hypothetical protein
VAIGQQRCPARSGVQRQSEPSQVIRFLHSQQRLLKAAGALANRRADHGPIVAIVNMTTGEELIRKEI